MKTPREILLTRHRAAEPKLDAIRRVVVSELNNQATKERSGLFNLVAWLLGCSNNLWRELVWPCRHVWAGLTAVWVVILVVNFSMRDHSQSFAEKSAPPTAEMVLTWQQQQQLLAELLGPDEPRAAAPAGRNTLPPGRPKPSLPRPSSERLFQMMTA
jgi:hypothetical protein